MYLISLNSHATFIIHEQENSLHPPLMLGGGRRSKNSNKSQAQIQAEEREGTAERKRKSRASRSQEKKAQDTLANTKRRRKCRAEQSPEEKALANAKNRLAMEQARAVERYERESQSCTFQDTQVWETPGKDYLHGKFEDCAERAVQLWYDNNGSWRDRELKWLVGYLHAVDCLEEKRMEDTTRNVFKCLDNLYGVIEVGVKHRMTITKVVHRMLSKENWRALRKWQEDECPAEEFEMSALLWIADNVDVKQCETAGLIEDVKFNIDPTLEKSLKEGGLKGLRLQVPGYWWKDEDTGKQLASRELWECEIADVNLFLPDVTERYFKIKCIDPDDEYPDDSYQMTYGDVKKYADTSQPDFSLLDLPASPKPKKSSKMNYIDHDHVDLCKHTFESLSEASGNNTNVILREYIYSRVEQIIECQRLTPAKQQELGQRFLQAQGRGVSWGKKDFGGGSIDAPLLTCACCGYRSFDNEEISGYQDFDLGTDLCLLKMNYEEREIHNSRIEQGVGDPLVLPVNKAGKTKVFETWKVYSVWPQDRDWVIKTQQAYNQDRDASAYDDNLFEDNPLFGGKRLKYYHLHPEFVDEYTKDSGKVGFKAKICGHCSESIDARNKIPERSVANGIDFGDYRRIGLESLTLRERLIISKVRHYLNIIKIESNAGKLRENTHSALKGCGIMFDHDSPQVVADLLTPDSINGSVELQFVGPDGKYDSLIAKAIKSANVSGRAHVIYQWLAVLMRINKWYEDDDPLPSFYNFRELMQDCNNELAQRAQLTASEDTSNIARDDYAQIRQATTAYDSTSASNKSDNEFPMRCVYLTSQNKTTNDNRADHDHDYLVNTAAEIDLDVKEEKRQYNATVKKAFREKNPVNEFLTFDEGLVKAHVDVFLLGTAYKKSTPRLTAKERIHLLMQFTTAAASCQPLIFHLFDQMQRHETIKAVHAKTQDREQWSKFVKEFMSNDFQGKLKQAVANPHSKNGRYVMKKLTPILNSTGKSATFGALERDRSKGEILACARRFGCAPTFLTFAIDDVNSATAIRLTMRSSNNIDYPSCVTGDVNGEVQNGFANNGEIPIPKTYIERFVHLAKNPVGAALVYKKFVEDVLSILIGRKPFTKRTTFTSWDHDSSGISGTNWAYYGKTETTGRGSLHFHVVLWGGMSPDVLELVSDIPELCKKLGSVLESMYSASLDKNYHIADLTMKELRRVSNDPHTKIMMPPRPLQIPPDPSEEAIAFKSYVSDTVCQRGIHEHTFTCYKGTTGYNGCRLNKPSGLRADTNPVNLEQVEDPDEEYKYDVREKVISRHQVDTSQKQSLFPLSSSDPRNVVWEMKRPEEEPLKSLPQVQDVTRHIILRKLHEQMLPSSSDDDNRVFYNPPKDENCLIRAMLKGLERVKPDEAKGKTTKSVRVELMDFLIDHPSEKMNPCDSNSLTFEQLADAQQNARDGQESNVGEKNVYLIFGLPSRRSYCA